MNVVTVMLDRCFTPITSRAEAAWIFSEPICERECEGIVAKHKLAPYVSKPQSWFKVLNPAYTQKRGRKDMFDRFREREHAAVPWN